MQKTMDSKKIGVLCKIRREIQKTADFKKSAGDAKTADSKKNGPKSPYKFQSLKTVKLLSSQNSKNSLTISL